MNLKNAFAAVAVAAVMTVAAVAAQANTAVPPAAAPQAQPAPMPVESCYGVAKAGKHVAVEVPLGVCEKLENGTLVAPAVGTETPAAPVEKK